MIYFKYMIQSVSKMVHKYSSKFKQKLARNKC